MQDRKLIITLALLVLLPLSLLAWQGLKISQDTQQLNDARFTSLVTARLNQVDTVVQSYFEEMQLKWSLLIPQWQLDSNATRERINNDGNIRQIFVLDPQRIRSFPPTDKDITAAEKVFVDRLASVWRDPEILFSNQVNTSSVEQVASINERLETESIVASLDSQKQSAPASFSSSNSAIKSYESATVVEETVMVDDIAQEPSSTMSSSLDSSLLDSSSLGSSSSKPMITNSEAPLASPIAK
ncbi:MAG: hypothetical protein V7749_01395, partial [Cocleimonas sp.]